MDSTQFGNITSLVIDKLEGGYYHPDMLKDGRVKDSRYSSSGETMFGIDRKNGGAMNNTPQGQAFWKLIDNANARKLWAYNYHGGSLEPPLKALASQMVQPQYESMSNRYLIPDAKALVDSDDRLVFHFAYATWNGAGWFNKFAQDINNAVQSGVRDTTQLTQVALNSRTKEGLRAGSPPNSLIAQTGAKIASFINTLESTASAGLSKSAAIAKENPLGTTLLTAISVVFFFLIYKTFKTNKK